MSDTHHYPILLQHGVVPDVLLLPEGLSYDLTVQWPNATLDAPGKELDREDTQPEPKIYLNPAPTEKHNNLVLIMTDPDLTVNNDTSFGQVRHWLAINVSTKEDGELVITPEANTSPYVGPAPLPNYLYARPHRYVFIVARPTDTAAKITVSSEHLRELQRPYAAAISGKQREDVQDLKDRWGFNTRSFIEEQGLKVEAVTFMRVGGNVKSAAANAGMMAQALFDKVVGK